MKKLIALVLGIVMFSPAFAGDYAKLNIKISNPIKENKYFLCLYGIGCLSIHAGNHGKSFPVMPETDIGNIQKIVITDITNMRMHMQPSVRSCDVVVHKGQKLTITGQLAITNHGPHINNLRCSLA